MKLPLKFSFKQKPGPLIGLDINSNNISAIQLDLAKTDIQVTRYASLATPANIVHEGLLADPQAAGEAIRELIDLLELPKKGPHPVANIAIPAQSVIIRIMPVPVGMPTDELSDVVRQEAVNNLPFPIDDANIDWSQLTATERLDPDGVKRVDVIFAAVQKTIVDSYWQMADYARIKIGRLDISSLSAVKALSFTEQLKQDGSHTMVVNIRQDATDIVLVKNSMPLFSRSVLVGLETILDGTTKGLSISNTEALALLSQIQVTGAQIADNSQLAQVQQIARTTLGDLAAEIGRSLDFYMSHVGAVQVNQILLCGAGCTISDLNQFIANRLNLSTITAVPFEKVILTPDLMNNANQAGEAMSLGLVLDPNWPNAPTVTLDLNKGGPSVMFTESAEADIEEEEEIEEVPTPWFVPALSAGVIAFLIIVSTWAFFDLYKKPKMEEEYKELETTIAAAKSKADTAAKQNDENKILERKKQLLEGIVKHGTVFTNILLELEKNIPADVQMTALAVSNTGFTLAGNTVNFKNASHYAVNLGNSNFFNNLSLHYVKRLKKRPEQIGFEITGFLATKDFSSDVNPAATTTTVKPKVLDFYATWCAPCKKLMPIMEAAEHKYSDTIEFVKLDVDDPRSHDLVQKYDVHSVPNLFFIDPKGNTIENINGFASEDVIDTALTTLSKTSSLPPPKTR
jgi:type IV pilus assembly protein PilM